MAGHCALVVLLDKDSEQITQLSLHFEEDNYTSEKKKIPESLCVDGRVHSSCPSPPWNIITAVHLRGCWEGAPAAAQYFRNFTCF